MKKTGVSRFILPQIVITLLIVLYTLPAFATSVNVTVIDGGTSGWVAGSCDISEINCVGQSYNRSWNECFASTSNPSDGCNLYTVGGSGYDSNGNYDSGFAWTGCPNPSGNDCYIPAPYNANVTATFYKVYGLPSNVSVQLQGSGTGNVSSYPGNINCGNGYTTCSGKINSGAESYIFLMAHAANGSQFAGWSGCPLADAYCSNYPGMIEGYTCCDITPGQNATVSATFTSTPPPSSAQGPAFSIPMGIFLALVGLGIILWRRKKMDV